MKKIKILTFVGHYLPGYKSGGPLRTILNMVDHLGDEFEFMIVTRDRDLGDESPYESIMANSWQMLGDSHVFYVSPECSGIREVVRIIKSTPHDILYLNSFFDPIFTIKILFARRFLSLTDKPIVVAPRGEFSKGALSLKKLKKRIYIFLSKFIGLYKDVLFQASSEHEKKDVIDALGVPVSHIGVAIDLPEKQIQESLPLISERKYSDTLKVVFLSRLSPKKNLDYALKVLMLVKQKVEFDIYGPIEDFDYWLECQSLLDNLPPNVLVRYLGSVMPSEVRKIFSQYDIFFFPTRGENYGHVIAESLSVGTPVLLSDQTPWEGLESQGLGWNVSLVSPTAFAEKIDHFASMDFTVRLRKRVFIQARAMELLQSTKIIEDNRNLFRVK